MAEVLNILSSTKSSGGKSRLSFPNKIYDDNTDYIKFDFYNYTGPFAQVSNSGTVAANGTKSPGSDPYNEYNGTEYTKYEFDGGNKTILMYMPEDIQAAYSANWGGKGFTNIAADALRAGAQVTGNQASAGGFISSVTSALTGAAGRVPSLAAQGIADAISGLPGGIGGSVGINDVLQTTTGVVLNPNVELLFEGFGLRQFDLSFKMVPRNLTEAKDIREIVGSFKKVSLPTLGQAPGGITDVTSNIAKLFSSPDAAGSGAAGGAPDNNANYIGVPGLCHVQFMKGNNLHPYLPQYKVCAITNVKINYTPDGTYATYIADNASDYGSPVATELTLSFQESKLVYAQDIFLTGVTY